MILLLFVVFAFLAFLCYHFSEEFFTGFFLVLTCIVFIVVIVLIIIVANGKVIDNKIALYEEENHKIEEQITAIVEQYLGYEEGAYKNAKFNDSPLIIETMYPELKGNEMVQEEMQLYVANHKQLIQLKEEKADLPRIKWLLYFGG